MLKTLLACAILILLSGCTESHKAERLLHNMGYKNVKITGYKFFACSDEDTYHTGFKALSPAGIEVSGVVCDGFLFRRATVRFD